MSEVGLAAHELEVIEGILAKRAPHTSLDKVIKLPFEKEATNFRDGLTGAVQDALKDCELRQTQQHLMSIITPTSMKMSLGCEVGDLYNAHSTSPAHAAHAVEDASELWENIVRKRHPDLGPGHDMAGLVKIGNSSTPPGTNMEQWRMEQLLELAGKSKSV